MNCAMELPIALVVLALVVGFAWSSPELAAVVFVVTCLVAAGVATLSIVARLDRR